MKRAGASAILGRGRGPDACLYLGEAHDAPSPLNLTYASDLLTMTKVPDGTFMPRGCLYSLGCQEGFFPETRLPLNTILRNSAAWKGPGLLETLALWH